MTIWPSNFTSGHVPKSIESGESNRYLYMNVHSSIIPIAKMWKQPVCPLIDEGKSQIRSVQYNRILLGLKREEHPETCYDMDDP